MSAMDDPVYTHREVDALKQENARLREVVEMMINTLEGVEWVREYEASDTCAWCHKEIHADDCERENAIRAGNEVLGK